MRSERYLYDRSLPFVEEHSVLHKNQNKDTYIKGVNMLTINILCVGKIKEDYLKNAVNEYIKRLSKYCKIKIIELQDEKIPENINEKIAEDIKNKEAERMLKHIKKDTYCICLELNGKELTSEEFSKKIQDISNISSSITFVIGGTLGIGEEILNLSKEKICFSKMTFPHQLIRIFLLEQIFRGFKIANNETYHR